MGRTVEQLASTFSSVLSNPEHYLDPTENVRQTCLRSTKVAYALCKASCGNAGTPSGPLTELYTEGFDIEQVWEQLQLLNTSLLSHLSKEADTLSHAQDFALLPSRDAEDIANVESDDEYSGDEPGSENGPQGSDHDIGHDQIAEKSGATGSAAKPNFFDLKAMEKYLNEAERQPLLNGQ